MTPFVLISSERSKAEAEAQALAQSQPSRETFDISSKITGIHYKKVNLIGRQTKKYLLQHISWTNWLRFSILYYILQDHMATKRIITRKLWENNGLNGFLINILDHGKPQVIKVGDSFAFLCLFFFIFFWLAVPFKKHRQTTYCCLTIVYYYRLCGP